MTASTSATAPLAPAAPSISRDGVAASALTWLGLVAYLTLAKHLLDHAFVDQGQRAAFSWPMVAAVAVAGLVGVWFAHRTGFPAALEPRISNRQRLLYPALIGIAFGGLAVAHDLSLHITRFFLEQSGVPSFNAPFPRSLLLYPGGAILVEAIYRLLPIPLLLWLVSSVALGGRAQTHVFWVIAALTSLIEPAGQVAATVGAGALGLAASLAVVIFGFNLTQAAMFRRYGFLASITTRLGMYVVWHVGYGNFICRC